MKTLLALAFALLSNVASAAYTYTYTNTIPTVSTDTFPLFYGGEPTKVSGLRLISFSVLLDNMINPNTTYENTDVLAKSFQSSNSIGGYYFSSGYASNLIPYFNATLQTDNNGMINDWSLNVGGGHFAMNSRPGLDRVSQFDVFNIEEGETTVNGHWTEAKVNYTKNTGDNSDSGFNLYTVTPIPEPKTYVMFLVGIGIIGFAVRRKRTFSQPTTHSIAL